MKDYLRFIFILLLSLINLGCAHYENAAFTIQSDTKNNDFGVLIMAHGGSSEWNENVLMAIKPLQEKYKIEIAFGMADAARMQKSVQKLEARGAKKIGVVRLFVSAGSWYTRTEQILGLRPGAPKNQPIPISKPNKKQYKSNHHMQFWKIKTRASFALSKKGLSESSLMGAVLVDRAQTLKRNPKKEDVLILAHGLRDDIKNNKLLESLDLLANKIRSSIPFKRVKVEALREDWPENSKKAKRRIRIFFQQAKSEGRAVILIPFRVYGSGPYAEILKDFKYISNNKGLLPHPNVTKWISNQIQILEQELFKPIIH
tara:strand:- start:216 stop:1160 length:945 start_codon:yes stop_codon:yes gene_type:complete